MIKCMVKCFSKQLQIESASKKLEVVKNQGEIWAFKNEITDIKSLVERHNSRMEEAE